jgi:hypothetical protein
MQTLILILKLPYRIVRGWFRLFFFKYKGEAMDRYGICTYKCDKSKETVYGKVCTECGCPLKAKVQDLNEKCPIGKW